MQHTLILSDLHLWQATDHEDEDLWMRYRHRRFTADGQIAALLQRVYAQIGAEPLELILNGDLFDFDVPPVVRGRVVSEPTPRTGRAARARLAKILDDHEEFLSTLATVLARGDRVVFLSGNHDIQLSLREVRNYLVERLINRLRILFPNAKDYKTHERIQFRAWYYQTESGIHVEHGSQYDLYCSVLDPTAPLATRPGRRLQPNAGSLVMEYLIGRLGYFNPNVESSFLLGAREYLSHWWTFYKNSKRSLVGTFFFGALRIVWQLGCTYGWRGPRKSKRAPVLEGASASAAHSKRVQRQQREHTALFALPDVRAAIRLLCLDRVLLVMVGLITLALGCLWLPLGGLVLAATLVLCWLLRPPRASVDLGGVNVYIENCARAIARIYGVRAVVFGHTHQPFGRWERGVFLGNCGTWAPMYHDVACRIPIQENRPFIWLRQDGDKLLGGLYRFHDDDGRIYCDTDEALPVEPARRLHERSRRRMPAWSTVYVGMMRVRGLAKRGQKRRAGRGGIAIPGAYQPALRRAADP